MGNTINLFGELHPSYVYSFRSTSEVVSFLDRLLVKVAKNLSFSDFDFVSKVTARVASDYYAGDLSLFDKSLKVFYSQLTGGDCLLIEAFFDKADLDEKLSSRFIDSALFSKVISLDVPGYEFLSNESRESNWFNQIKSLGGYDLSVIVGAKHLRSESVISKDNLLKSLPGVTVNQYLMNSGVSAEFISDCNRLDRIITKFYNLYE